MTRNLALPLEGIRVLEWATYAQGPIAGSMLGSLGAEVIKIEEPNQGDPSRGVDLGLGADAYLHGRNVFFETLNANKKSITLDLKKKGSMEVVHRLVQASDVFLHNFRQGIPEKLRLDYESLRDVNPSMIYGVASGYGIHGGMSQRPALDPVGFARSGVMEYLRTGSGDPPYARSGFMDVLCGTLLAYGIITALWNRIWQSSGQVVNVSQISSALWLETIALNGFLLTGRAIPKWDRKEAQNPLFNFYRTGDGTWVFLALLNSDRFWHRACEALGIVELEGDSRFCSEAARKENRGELIQILEKRFAAEPHTYWETVLNKYPEFVYEFVRSIEDVPKDPVVLENSYIGSYDHPVFGAINLLNFPIQIGTVKAQYLPAPELGEHTEEILAGVCGYSWDEITKLQDASIICPGQRAA